MTIKWAPSEWKIHKVGQVLKKVSKPVLVEAKTIYREIGIRSHGKGIFHKNETTGAEIGNKRVFWIEPDCFIVNIVFAWERAVAQTSEAEQDMIASHRFPMYKPVKGLLDLNFITYFFKSEHGNRLLKLASPGGAGRNKTLGQQRFTKLEIPLPPLEEQHKIAEILGAWDEAITLTQRLIEAKQKRKKGLMQQLLTGKVRFPGFEEDKIRSLDQEMPAGWRLTKVRDVAHVRSGSTPLRAKAERYFSGGTIPWVKTMDLNNNLVTRTHEKITQTALDETSCPLLPAGTLLIAMYGGFNQIGRTGLMGFEGSLNQALSALLVDDSVVLSRYLLYWFNEKVGLWKRFAASSRKDPNITKRDVESFPVLLPPIQEQQKIAAVLTTCDDEIDLLQRKAAALREQKKGLMQQLLTGKVRVKV